MWALWFVSWLALFQFCPPFSVSRIFQAHSQLVLLPGLFFTQIFTYFTFLSLHLYLNILLLFFFFGRTGVWTQGFPRTKQALYRLSCTSSPFCSDYSGDGVLRTIWPGLPRTLILLIQPFQVARITGVSHQCLALSFFLGSFFCIILVTLTELYLLHVFVYLFIVSSLCQSDRSCFLTGIFVCFVLCCIPSSRNSAWHIEDTQ
jgi:hypothetical protein